MLRKDIHEVKILPADVVIAKPVTKKWYSRPYAIVLGFFGLLSTIILCYNGIITNLPPAVLFMYANPTTDFVNHKMHVSCFVTINNAGKSTFDVITAVRTNVWLVPINTLTKDEHFEWQKYMHDSSCYHTAIDTSFMGTYSPDDSVRNSFDFFIDSAKAKQSTVIVKAVATINIQQYFVLHKKQSIYCYYAIIRGKRIDPESKIKK